MKFRVILAATSPNGVKSRDAMFEGEVFDTREAAEATVEAHVNKKAIDAVLVLIDAVGGEAHFEVEEVEEEVTT